MKMRKAYILLLKMIVQIKKVVYLPRILKHK